MIEYIYKEPIELASTFKRFMAILFDGILLSVCDFVVFFFVVPSPKAYDFTVPRSGAVKPLPPGSFRSPSSGAAKPLPPRSFKSTPSEAVKLIIPGIIKRSLPLYLKLNNISFIDVVKLRIDGEILMLYVLYMFFCLGFFLVYFLYILNNLHGKLLLEKNCLD